MNVVSLYTGILGLDAAAHAAGFTTVAACDSEPYCRDVIAHYLPQIPVYASDEEITRARLCADGVTGDITAVIGGPPCQDASIAGGRAGQGGNRWRWPQYLRVVGDIRPRWFVAENPPGILSVNDKRAFGWLLSEMESLGYAVAWATYGASDVDAPHQRKRVFIVGRLADASDEGLEAGRPPRRLATPYAEPPHSGPALADSLSLHSKRRGTAGDVASTAGHPESPTQQRQRGRNAANDSGTDVAHAEKLTTGNAGDPAHAEPAGRATWPIPIGGSSSCGGRGGHDRPGQALSRLGELFNGFPTDLVTHPRWPARPGEPQDAWEPPRLRFDEQDRVARLKALGNAVVPAQAYPVFKAIADVELARV